jgi:rare lipoprotein A
MKPTIVALSALFLLMLPNTSQARECGLASWYSEGSRTANGERYRPDGLTAAHRSLRFGTILKVTASNGKQVLLRINDRGPAKWTGRFLDLSRGAANVLGFIKRGVGRVCIERISQ